MRYVICQLCSNTRDIDFCRDKKIISKKFECEECNSPYDLDYIEFCILNKIKLLIDFYFNQDLECKKCKMQKADLCWHLCKCSGEYIETFSFIYFKNNNSNMNNLKDFFTVIISICNYYKFEKLKAYVLAVISP